MYKDLLPIGSVVLLKGGTKRLMICSRVICEAGTERIHDYAGCYYPEGIVDSSQMFFFEQEAVDKVYFVGFQDEEEIQFRAGVLAELDTGTLCVEDGQIKLKKD